MKSVAFICRQNSCRSQMAEGFGKKYGRGIIEVYSAGTETFPEVRPQAVQVMEEEGVDIKDQYPKLLEDLPIKKVDILVTMGCGVTCPYFPADYREDWGLEDPSGGDMAGYRECRDLIEEKGLYNI